MPLTALFGVIALAFAAIAVWSGEAGQWPIAAAAAALAVWMATLAWGAVRRMRS